MKAYIVGGAVRDELLGLPVKDRDFVVVGSTPEQMVKDGYRPVGKDFPVFLHPQTHEEYALARTERKSGRGYKGFTVHASPEVTLEEDLKRRDLTINAIAKDPDTGAIVDPFHGRDDLRGKNLRHVSEAFAEDPVRILRVARFAARFGFAVAPETMQLMKTMVESGEADYLVAERVWQEFAKGLGEPHPAKMFEVLEASGLLKKAFPEIRRIPSFPPASLPVRFALLAWSLSEKEAESLAQKLKAPNEVRDLALLVARLKEPLKKARTAAELLEVLKAADAFRRPERFEQLLEGAAHADASIERTRFARALQAATSVDAGAIAKNSPAQDIARRIDEARRDAIAKLDG